MALAFALAWPPASAAHLFRANGQWTFRYFSRPYEAGFDAYMCDDNPAYYEDPFNVIFWQYGEGYRMNDHVHNDTTWDHYPGHIPRNQQIICGDIDSQPGNYRYHRHSDFDDFADPPADPVHAITAGSGLHLIRIRRGGTSGPQWTPITRTFRGGQSRTSSADGRMPSGP